MDPEMDTETEEPKSEPEKRDPSSNYFTWQLGDLDHGVSGLVKKVHRILARRKEQADAEAKPRFSANRSVTEK
jgi:hypothetical protein